MGHWLPSGLEPGGLPDCEVMKTATLSALLLAAFSVGDVSARTAPAPDPVAVAMAALAQIPGEGLCPPRHLREDASVPR